MKTNTKKKTGPNLRAVSRLYDESQDADVVLVCVEKTDNRGRTRCILNMSDFLSPSRLESALQDAGADPKQYKVDDLIDSLPDQAGVLSNKTGWAECGDEKRYLLYKQLVQLDDQRVLFLNMKEGGDSIGIGQTSGSFEDWQKHVAEPMCKSKPCLFTLCATFAGPLLEFSSLPETMILNAFAQTSKGKTTMIRAATATFGNPNEFPGWRQSPSKLDEVALNYNDNVMTLDDTETNTGSFNHRLERVYEVIHTVTAGRPKGISRMAIGAGSRERYRCLALSSSPMPILWKLANHRDLQDSDRVRFLEYGIPETDYGIWDPSVTLAKGEPPQGRQETEALAQHAGEYFGTAGELWIDYLTKIQGELKGRVVEISEQFIQKRKTKETRKNRIASKVGLIWTAGEMAVEAKILPCSKRDVQLACRWAYNEIVKTAFGHELGFEEIVEHLADVLEDEFFPAFSQAEISGNAKLKMLDGFVNKRNEKVIMTADGFERLCEDLLPTNSAARARTLTHIRRELTRTGIYLTDARGNHVQSVSIAKNGQRRWVINLNQLLSCRDKMQPESVRKGKRSVRSKRTASRPSKTSRMKPRTRKSRSEQPKRRPTRKSRN